MSVGVLWALSGCSGDRARVTARAPSGSATGNNDRNDESVVPESPARIDSIH